MTPVLLCVVAALFSVSGGCPVGRNFITAFLTNYVGIDKNHTLQLVLTSQGTPATVQVRLFSPPFTTKVELGGKETKWVNVPKQAELQAGISSSVIQVTSSADISVVAFNLRTRTGDGTVVLPSDQLGVEYRVFTPQGPHYQHLLGVVNGPQPNSVIFNSAADLNIKGFNSKWSANRDVKVELGPYQSIQLQSPSTLTGMRVRSQHPLAVLAGNQCYVGRKTCEHLYEQLYPVHLLSTSYVIPPMHIKSDAKDYASIVTTQDGTVVTVTLGKSSTTKTLQAGQLLTESIPIHTPVKIQSNKKVMVMVHSDNYPNDPFLISVLPQEVASDWTVDTIKGFKSTLVVLTEQIGLGSVKVRSKTTDLSSRLKWWVSPDKKYVWSIFPLGEEGGEFNIQGNSIVSVYIYGGKTFYGYGTTAVCRSVSGGCPVGRNFITAFLTNYVGNDKNHTLQLVLTSKGTPATVQVRLFSPAFTTKVELGGKETKWVNVPKQAELQAGISSSVIQVTSSADISVVSFNLRTKTGDGTVVLPSDQLGVEYRVFTPQGPHYQHLLGVVNGPQPNSVIFNSAADLNIKGFNSKWSANRDVKVELGPYQSIQLQSPSTLTGMRVRSQHPLAVLAGNQCYVGRKTCEHLYEQLYPVHLLSTSYVIPPMHIKSDAKDYASIVTTQDGTVVTVTLGKSSTTKTLQAGQLLTESIPIHTPVKIQSNKKVMVMVYSDNYPNDPFLISVLPQEVASDWTVDTIKSFKSTLVVLTEQIGLGSVKVRSKTTDLSSRLKWWVSPDKKYVWSIFPLGEEGGEFNIQGNSIVSVYIYGGKTFYGYGTTGVCSSGSPPATPPPDPCDSITCREKEECKQGVCVHVSTATYRAVGRDFITAFLTNYVGIDKNHTLQLVLTSQGTPATVQVRLFSPRFTTKVELGRKETKWVNLPKQAELKAGISTSVIQVTSSADISVVAFNLRTKSGDGTVVLPSDQLGVEYWVFTPQGPHYQNLLGVVNGPQPNSVIFNSAANLNIKGLNSKWSANRDVKVDLRPYESIQLQSPSTLTGMRVRSQHPLAVLAGNQCLVGRKTCEHVYEQLLPVHLLSTSYVIPPMHIKSDAKDYASIVTTQDGTVVTVTLGKSSTTKTLQAGQLLTESIPIHTPVKIQSNKKVMVMVHSDNYPNDPFLISVLPQEVASDWAVDTIKGFKSTLVVLTEQIGLGSVKVRSKTTDLSSRLKWWVSPDKKYVWSIFPLGEEGGEFNIQGNSIVSVYIYGGKTFYGYGTTGVWSSGLPPATPLPDPCDSITCREKEECKQGVCVHVSTATCRAVGRDFITAFLTNYVGIDKNHTLQLVLTSQGTPATVQVRLFSPRFTTKVELGRKETKWVNLPQQAELKAGISTSVIQVTSSADISVVAFNLRTKSGDGTVVLPSDQLGVEYWVFTPQGPHYQNLLGVVNGPQPNSVIFNSAANLNIKGLNSKWSANRDVKVDLRPYESIQLQSPSTLTGMRVRSQHPLAVLAGNQCLVGRKTCEHVYEQLLPVHLLSTSYVIPPMHIKSDAKDYASIVTTQDGTVVTVTLGKSSTTKTLQAGQLLTESIPIHTPVKIQSNKKVMVMVHSDNYPNDPFLISVLPQEVASDWAVDTIKGFKSTLVVLTEQIGLGSVKVRSKTTDLSSRLKWWVSPDKKYVWSIFPLGEEGGEFNIQGNSIVSVYIYGGKTFYGYGTTGVWSSGLPPATPLPDPCDSITCREKEECKQGVCVHVSTATCRAVGRDFITAFLTNYVGIDKNHTLQLVLTSQGTPATVQVRLFSPRFTTKVELGRKETKWVNLPQQAELKAGISTSVIQVTSSADISVVAFNLRTKSGDGTVVLPSDQLGVEYWVFTPQGPHYQNLLGVVNGPQPNSVIFNSAANLNIKGLNSKWSANRDVKVDLRPYESIQLQSPSTLTGMRVRSQHPLAVLAGNQCLVGRKTCEHVYEQLLPVHLLSTSYVIPPMHIKSDAKDYASIVTTQDGTVVTVTLGKSSTTKTLQAGQLLTESIPIHTPVKIQSNKKVMVMVHSDNYPNDPFLISVLPQEVASDWAVDTIKGFKSTLVVLTEQIGLGSVKVRSKTTDLSSRLKWWVSPDKKYVWSIFPLGEEGGEFNIQGNSIVSVYIYGGKTFYGYGTTGVWSSGLPPATPLPDPCDSITCREKEECKQGVCVHVSTATCRAVGRDFITAFLTNYVGIDKNHTLQLVLTSQGTPATVQVRLFSPRFTTKVELGRKETKWVNLPKQAELKAGISTSVIQVTSSADISVVAFNLRTKSGDGTVVLPSDQLGVEYWVFTPQGPHYQNLLGVVNGPQPNSVIFNSAANLNIKGLNSKWSANRDVKVDLRPYESIQLQSPSTLTGMRVRSQHPLAVLAGNQCLVGRKTCEHVYEQLLPVHLLSTSYVIPPMHIKSDAKDYASIVTTQDGTVVTVTLGKSSTTKTLQAGQLLTESIPIHTPVKIQSNKKVMVMVHSDNYPNDPFLISVLPQEVASDWAVDTIKGFKSTLVVLTEQIGLGSVKVRSKTTDLSSRLKWWVSPDKKYVWSIFPLGEEGGEFNIQGNSIVSVYIYGGKTFYGYGTTGVWRSGLPPATPLPDPCDSITCREKEECKQGVCVHVSTATCRAVGRDFITAFLTNYVGIDKNHTLQLVLTSQGTPATVQVRLFSPRFTTKVELGRKETKWVNLPKQAELKAGISTSVIQVTSSADISVVAFNLRTKSGDGTVVLPSDQLGVEYWVFTPQGPHYQNLLGVVNGPQPNSVIFNSAANLNIKGLNSKWSANRDVKVDLRPYESIQLQSPSTLTGMRVRSQHPLAVLAGNQCLVGRKTCEHVYEQLLPVHLLSTSYVIPPMHIKSDAKDYASIVTTQDGTVVTVTLGKSSTTKTLQAGQLLTESIPIHTPVKIQSNKKVMVMVHSDNYPNDPFLISVLPQEVASDWAVDTIKGFKSTLVVLTEQIGLGSVKVRSKTTDLSSRLKWWVSPDKKYVWSIFPLGEEGGEFNIQGNSIVSVYIYGGKTFYGYGTTGVWSSGLPPATPLPDPCDSITCREKEECKQGVCVHVSTATCRAVGRDFITAFLTNYVGIDKNHTLQLVLTSQGTPATVQVRLFSPRFTTKVELGRKETKWVNLPQQAELKAGISTSVIQVTSSADISVVAFNLRTKSGDGTVVLPSDQLGVEYWVFTPQGPHYQNLLGVVNGPQPNSVIFNSAANLNIKGLNSKWSANRDVKVDLRPYESIQLQSPSTLTGMRVRSQHPLAVLAGNQCLVGRKTCEHVYEQLLPVHLLSTSYVIPPMHIKSDAKDYASIVTTQDGTVVTVTLGKSSTTKTLQAGQLLTESIPIHTPVKIQSNKKVMVMVHSDNYPNDPFLISVLPQEVASDWAVDTIKGFKSTLVVLTEQIGLGSVKVRSKTTDLSSRLKWWVSPDKKYVWSIFPLGEEGGEFNIQGNSIVSVYIYGGKTFYGYGTTGVWSSGLPPATPLPDPCDSITCREKEECKQGVCVHVSTATCRAVGRDFITAFLTNYVGIDKNHTLQLVLTSQGTPATVQVRLFSPRFTTKVELGRKETKWVNLPQQAELKAGISTSVIQVTSSADISVVAFNLRTKSGDGTVVLPSDQLGVEYWVFTPQGPHYQNLLGVVNGPQPNSVIFNSAANLNIKGLNSKWSANRDVKVDLRPYESIQLQSPSTLTGMRVRSQHPLAVLAGNQCLVGRKTCEHVYEQLLPVHLLSTSYVIPPMHIKSDAKDYASIVTTQDGTVVTVTLGKSSTTKTLQAGQLLTESIPIHTPVKIQSNKKVMVMVHSDNYPNDPFLISVLPQEVASDWAVDTIKGFKSTLVVLTEQIGLGSVKVRSKTTDLSSRLKWWVSPDKKYVWSIFPLGEEGGEFNIQGNSIVSVYIYGGKTFYGYGTTGVWSSGLPPATPLPDPCDSITCREKEECKQGVCVHVSTATCRAVGRDFITAFLTNYVGIDKNHTLQLVLTSQGTPATVQVRLFSPRFTTKVELGRKETKWVNLPKQAELKAGISTSVIQVTSSADISVVAFNLRTKSGDGTVVLPSDQLGVEYWVFTPQGPHYQNLLGVVNGPQPNSVIFNSAANLNIKGLNSKWSANRDVKVDLRPYESIQLQSPSTLTGMRVRSQHPLAVLAGNQCLVGRKTCEHVYEQLLPVHLLSTSYVIPPMHIKSDAKDYASIVTTQDGTVVTVTLGKSSTTKTLQAGQLLTESIPIHTPVKIQSNKKVMVMVHSDNYPNDPFLISVLPQEVASDWAVDTIKGFKSTLVVLTEQIGLGSVKVRSKTTDLSSRLKWWVSPDKKYVWSIFPLGEEGGEFNIQGNSIVSVYIYGGKTFYGYGTTGVWRSGLPPATPLPDPCDSITCREKEECKQGVCVHVSTATCRAVGRDFITAFLTNYVGIDKNHTLQLVLTSQGTPATVQVRLFSPRFTTKVELGRKETKWVNLPKQAELKAGISTSVIQVTSSADISVVAFNLRTKSGDGTVVLPSDQLGVEYWVFTPQGPYYQNLLGVVNGPQPNSVIFNSAANLNIKGLNSKWSANRDVKVDLRPYESIQLQSPSTLTGMRVRSQHPLAVLAGNQCLVGRKTCEHVYEQLLPVHLLSTSYLIPPMHIKRDAKDYASIVTTQDGTVVTVTLGKSSTTKTLQAGQVLKESIPIHTPVKIQSNKKVMVMVHSDNYPNDPFLISVLPQEVASDWTVDTIKGFKSTLVVLSERDGLGSVKVRSKTTDLSSRLKWWVSPDAKYVWSIFPLGEKGGEFNIQGDSILSVYIYGGKTFYGYGTTGVRSSGSPPATPPPDPCDSITCREKEECKQGVCVHVSTAICWATGDPHYQTFDGHRFDFQGTCTYTMATVAKQDKGLAAFTVLTKNDHRGSRHVSFVRTVTVIVHNQTVVISRHRSRVQVNGELVYLPVSLAGGKLKVVQKGLYAVLTADFGLVVNYDWNTRLFITAPSSYFRLLGGLCGNYNGNRGDDLADPSGTVLSTVLAFAKSWKTEDRDRWCNDDCRGRCPSCSPQLKQKYGSKNFCGILTQTDGPFASCHKALEPSIFLDNCVFDVCTNKGAKQMLCDNLKSYDDTCLAEGIKVNRQWRMVAKCPLECPANSHYDACGLACPATCSDPEAPAKCKGPCVDGCQCNKDFVLSGDQCVRRKSCGCQHQGRYYPAGTKFWADNLCSKLCRCIPGKADAQCTPTKCKTSEVCELRSGVRDCYPLSFATCLASGDPHYRTFDGRKFDFQGTCTYVLSKSMVGGEVDRPLVPFEVQVQNENRGRNKAVAYTKTVSIIVLNHTLTMSSNTPGKVLVNGQYVNLPFEAESGASHLSVVRSGYFGVVRTSFGLTLKYDWRSYVTLTLPSSYSGLLAGLCGNWNSQGADDFLKPDRSSAPNATAFGSSWQVGGAVGCTNDCPGGRCPQCDSFQRKKYQSREYCGLMADKAGPFRQCHATVDPQGYLEDCVYDLCVYEGHATALCNALTAYTTACQDAGATVQTWRSDKLCPPSCPTNSHHQVCAPGCPQTCSQLKEPEACESAACREGCVCDDGFLLSDSACVPVAECGCVHRGLYYTSGQVFFPGVVGRCSPRCVCTADGSVECDDKFTCGSNERCALRDGVQACVPKQTGSCLALGVREYKSFDGRAFSVYGDCVFNMAAVEENDGGIAAFTVLVQHRTTQGRVTRKVEIQTYGYKITMDPGLVWEVAVDDIKAHLPLFLDNGKVQAFQSGIDIVVLTDFGLKVTYDTQSGVILNIPSTYKGVTAGLCGNYNGRPDDDLQLPNRQQAPTVEAFTAGWVVSQEGVKCQTGCNGTKCPGPEKPKESKTQNACDIIRAPQGALAGCHKVLPPAGYYDSCVKEAVTAGGGGAAVCRHVQMYVSLCQAAGATVTSWRSDTFCPLTCPAKSHYELCFSTSSSACASLSASPRYDPCREGCECDDGLVFDGGDCVHLFQCGCLVKGRYYKSGESVMLDDCDEVCSCKAGQFSCQAATCGKGKECNVKGGVLGCYPTDPCAVLQCREKERCVVKEDQGLCVAQSKAHCWAFGDPHYTTFDGRPFSFQGTCSYTLVNTTGLDSTLTPFSILTKNELRGNSEGSYLSSASLDLLGHRISITYGQRGIVEVDGVESNLPVNLDSGSITITASGIRATIQTTEGLEVTFDWSTLFMITVTSSYYGNLQGICGSYNGNADDDFTTRSGVSTSNITVWARSWSVADGDRFCYHSCEGGCPRCSKADRALYGGPQYCGVLADRSGPFASCFGKVPTKEFQADCLYDVCRNDGRQAVLCDALTDYVAECQEAGISVSPQWRTITKCPLACPEHSSYKLCGSACPASCGEPNPQCSQKCVEGCQCDPGYVLSGETCVHRLKECGCTYDGRYRLPGETFWSDSACEKKCVCNGETQQVACTSQGCQDGEQCAVVDNVLDCYPVSFQTCSAQGDPHFRSFDGRRFDFQGNCVYRLAHVCSGGPKLEKFEVLLENNNRGNSRVSYAKVVTVSVYGHSYTLSTEHHGHVLVDYELASLPFYSNHSGVKVYQSRSRSAVLETHFLRVSYDWRSSVRVQLASTYHSAICGLCGNMNGNPSDDLLLPDGKQAKNANEFGNSHFVEEVPGCSRECKDCAPPLQLYSKLPKDTAVCDVIVAKAGPLTDCIARVDSAQYRDDCIYDMVQTKGLQESACDIISDYVEACQEAGGIIQAWRRKDFCPMSCPENSVYVLSSSGCLRTCSSIMTKSREQCRSPGAEGCACMPGFLRSEDKCVHLRECGCHQWGRYLLSGQVFYPTSDCRQRCTCSSGTVDCVVGSCGAQERCAVVKGVRGCFPKSQSNQLSWLDRVVEKVNGVIG